MLDPIVLSEAMEAMVTRPGENGLLRKYYRFRPARFYGGIATADAVGCNLNCAFCWVDRPRKKPLKYGKYYPPAQVVWHLENIAKAKGFNKLRVSGSEPTIGREHLLEIINLVHKNYHFILETNGILLGYYRNYARQVAKDNVHVRVSLKGASREEFALLTNAKPEFFDCQLKALENLKWAGANFSAAIMSFAPDLAPIIDKLQKIDSALVSNLEVERMFLLPHIDKEMKRRRINERLKELFEK